MTINYLLILPALAFQVIFNLVTLKITFILKCLPMCIYFSMWVYAICVEISADNRFSGAEVVGYFELLNVNSKNQIQVLGKVSKCS